MQITPELSTFSILLIGFVLGLQHAIEADHLAAVSTIVSEKKNVWTASLVGGLWGIGHTISIFVVAVAVVGLKLQIPTWLESRLEAIVGVMLVILGVNALSKLLRKSNLHIHSHEHDGRLHTHIHAHEDETAADSHHYFSPRSVVVGMVHGLAGSAALMFLVLPAIKSPVLALGYILIFGVGSIGGMMAMSFLIGLPFHFTANRFEAFNKTIRLCAGVFSLGLGITIIAERLG